MQDTKQLNPYARIQELEAEVAALKADRDEWRDAYRKIPTKYLTGEAEADRLRALVREQIVQLRRLCLSHGGFGREVREIETDGHFSRPGRWHVIRDSHDWRGNPRTRYEKCTLSIGIIDWLARADALLAEHQ